MTWSPIPQAYDGQTEGKIDGAYAYAYVQYVNQNIGKESNDDLYLHANQAGQAATIATVSAVTGQKIDHFAEVNLAGFYQLAAAFGGIEVCIQPYPGNKGLNLTDYDPFTGTDNSGFDAYKDGYNKKKGGPQYLHLAAAQSLAFVRSRDTLPGTDLGRTKRQQAVIDYVIYQLKHEGVFGDLARLNSLLGTADKYLITDTGFNLLDFATDMRALNGQDLSFTTLPFTPENNVPVPGYPSPQDVNIIDVPAIQKLVASAFDPQPAAPRRRGAAKAARQGHREPGRARPGLQRDGRRLQRRPQRGRPGRAGRAGARRPRLQGRQGRERIRAGAGGAAGDAGLLRRGRGGERAADRGPVRRHGEGAGQPARGSRGGADRLDGHRRARGHRADEHGDGGAPSPRTRRSSAPRPPGQQAAAGPSATPAPSSTAGPAAAAPAARSRSRPTLPTAFPACTRPDLVVTLIGVTETLGKIRVIVAKAGLDGHDRGRR